MRRAVIRAVAVTVMAACFACIFLQMFDHWDHSETIGKDTESSLFVVALAVGLAIPVAGLIFRTSVVAEPRIDVADFSLAWNHPVFPKPPVPVSQPPPVLRI